MIDFYQKRKLRAIVNSRITHVVLGVILIAMALSAWQRFSVAMEMRERRLAAEQAAAALEVRRDELKAEVEYLSNERGIESEMRRQFDVARTGEQVVVILDDETKEATTTAPIVPVEEAAAWYQFWR